MKEGDLGGEKRQKAQEIEELQKASFEFHSKYFQSTSSLATGIEPLRGRC